MPHVGTRFRRFLLLTCTFVVIPCTLGTAIATTAVSSGAAHAAPAPLPVKGEQSTAVRHLQELLLRAGIHVAGGADGWFGNATATAVKAFQVAKGLPASGTVDEATAVALGFITPVAHLAVGASGTDVQQLQRTLQAVGITVKGGADGQYGPATATALKSFQKAQHLPVTGALDAYTAVLLAQRTKVAAAATLPSPGSSGPAVAALQRQLIAVGARPAGGADGQYGPATRRAVARFQGWAGVPSTGVIDRATMNALAKAAGTASKPKVQVLASFPLPRTCTFWNTWGAARAGGRRHEGTDIFAKRGTPVLAVADGRITRLRADFPGSRGGNQFWLTAKDGTKYFYGHLDGFADGIGVGVPVRAGQTIGYAGKTGLTTVVHLHLEIHPGGGAAVNPYPILRATAKC